MEGVTPTQSDVEQPHPPVNHSRPFFYVQPPSQPYYMYQWPMDPFGQYGFPASAFPFGRPYMAPYQYMQCPSYVVPQAPMQSTDYRRMSSFLPPMGSYDLRFRQHFQQMSLHRETSSAEAQTESRASVNKIANGLNGLHVREKSVEPDMVSSTPALTPYTHEVEKVSPQPARRPKKGADGADSAMYDESSQGGLEDCVLSHVLPLDGSSVHEQLREQDGRRNASVTSFHGKTNASDKDSDLADIQDSGAHVSESGEKSDLCEMTSVQSFQVKNVPAEPLGALQSLVQTTIDYDLPYQILRLPCDKTTTGLFLKDAYMNAAATLLPSKSYPLGSSYPYSFYPQVAPERQSILSPSLDELSSRDELFSTDVEDDPGPSQVHVDGDKLSETSGVPIGSDRDQNDSCSVCANMCACCGASLPDEDEALEPSDQDYGCDLDTGDVSILGDAQRAASHQHFSRSSRGQLVARPKNRKVLEEEMIQPDRGRGECGGLPHVAPKGERVKGPKSAQARSYFEHYQREEPGLFLDQESWTSSKINPRSRSSRPVNEFQEKVEGGGSDQTIPPGDGANDHLTVVTLLENLHDGGQLAKHLLSKGPEEMNTMTTMTLNIPSAKGAEDP